VIRIVVNGLDKAVNDMNALQARFPKFVNDTTLKAVLYVHSEIPDYPVYKSNYIRTFTLFRTITSLQGKAPDALSRVEPRFGKIVGIVGTRLSYAPWVIDKKRQTRSHKAHGWWNLQDVVRGLRKGIKKIYVEGVAKFFGGVIKG
jgi:hypothetical protein